MYLFNDACLFSRAITCPLREYPPINKTILTKETKKNNDSGLEFANSVKKKKWLGFKDLLRKGNVTLEHK